MKFISKHKAKFLLGIRSCILFLYMFLLVRLLVVQHGNVCSVEYTIPTHLVAMATKYLP
jgi:hypothetical protein